MERIIQIIKQESNTIEELMECAEWIMQRGDVFIIKLDGEREVNNYTVLILSVDKSFDTIRSDVDNLQLAMKNVLESYVEAMV